MKHSEFTKIKSHDNFKAGFQGALSLIVSEVIDWFTEKDHDGNYVRTKKTIDQWDYKRVQFAYSLKGADGNVLKYIDDLRPLFPSTEEPEIPFFPFDMSDKSDPQWEKTGMPNADDVELHLYQRIKEGGYFNYWAMATPELVGVPTEEGGTTDGGTMR